MKLFLCFLACCGVLIALYTDRARQIAQRAITSVTATDVPGPPHRPPLSPLSMRSVYAPGVVEGAIRTTALTAELTARVSEVLVREGQSVRAGEILAKLDDATWKSQVAVAAAKVELARAERVRIHNAASPQQRDILRAEVAAAEIIASNAHADLKRAKALGDRKAIAGGDLEKFEYAYALARARHRLALARLADTEAEARKDDLEIAGAKVSLAERELQHASDMLKKTVLRAPADGMILSVTVEAGQLVSPDAPTPLFTYTDPRVIRVRTFVEEMDALTLQVGQGARVEADGQPGMQYRGHIVSLAPTLSFKQNLRHRPDEHLDVKVRECLIELDNPGDLVIGLPVDVFVDPEPDGASGESKMELTKQTITR